MVVLWNFGFGELYLVLVIYGCGVVDLFDEVLKKFFEVLVVVK